MRCESDSSLKLRNMLFKPEGKTGKTREQESWIAGVARRDPLFRSDSGIHGLCVYGAGVATSGLEHEEDRMLHSLVPPLLEGGKLWLHGF